MNNKSAKSSMSKSVNLDTINYKVDDILEKIAEIKQSAITEERLSVWDMERDRKLEKVHEELNTYKSVNGARWHAYDIAVAEREKHGVRQYIIPIMIGAIGIIIADALSPLVTEITKAIFK